MSGEGADALQNPAGAPQIPAVDADERPERRLDVDEAARELRRPALEVVVSHTLAHDDVTSQGSRAVLHDAKICLS